MLECDLSQSRTSKATKQTDELEQKLKEVVDMLFIIFLQSMCFSVCCWLRF